MSSPSKMVTIIPSSGFIEIHIVMLTKYCHFRFRKTNIIRELSGIGHGKFIKHIQSRMGPIFFDGKDPRHICKLYIYLILQQIPQKIQIKVLGLSCGFLFTENAVPFVNNDNKAFFMDAVNFFQGAAQMLL